MRILIIHNEYAAFSGEEEAIGNMARVLNSHGHQVEKFRRSSSEISGSTAGAARAFLAGIYNPFSRRTISELLADRPVDLVQVQNLYPLISPSVLSACKEAGVPVVMRCPNYRLFCPNGLHLVRRQICERCLGFGREIHCILNNCEGSIFKSSGYAVRNAVARISGMIVNNVDCFLVLSEFQKRRFIDNGIPERKLAVLPNIAPCIDAPSEFHDGDYIAFVGRISSEKGIDDFLCAAERMPEARFAVAGGISESSEIRGSIPPNVEFRGFLSDGELEKFYHESRVLAFPSVCWEGFPNVVARAMAHAKPVVASDLGVLCDIVDNHETGILFLPGDVDDLVAKLTQLWHSPGTCREMGQRGRDKAQREYSEDSYYNRLIQAYEQVISASGSRV